MHLLKFFVAMENPFKPDDKVLTKFKGDDVEATVRLIWNNEVQVRCPDGQLRWRTDKTVWFPPAPGVSSAGSEMGSDHLRTPDISGPAEPPVPPQEPVPSAGKMEEKPESVTPDRAASRLKTVAKPARTKRRNRK